MANSNSGRHARKVTLDAAVSNAIAKAVDARKVAAFTVGAAGVLAGAAFAFGATPAMAAENGAAAGAASVPVEAGKKPGVEAENKDAAKSDKAKEEVKKNQTDVNKDSEQKSEEKKQPEEKPGKTNLEKKLANKTKTSTQSVVKVDGEAGVTETEQKTASVESVDNKATDSTAATDKTANSTPTANSARKRSKRATVEDKQLDDTKPENQDRASNNNAANQDPSKINPDTSDSTNTKIEINENNADTVPNAYAWGSSDNTYSLDGEKHTVTFHFAKPKDGSKITSIAIFPAKTNGFNNEKSERGIDFYSKNLGKHQSYSGEYIFTANSDGSATLTMNTLFRDGNLNGGAEKYVGSRSIFVYVTKDGSSTETIAYKTNVFRAVTLVPPKTSGSVVLKYNQPLTAEKVQAAITEAGNIETARSDKKSVNDQLSGTFTQNINVRSADAYDKNTFDAINAKKAGDDNTYVVGAKTLNAYMVTDLGFKSEAIPLTVARYDDRIDKPIVEDPTNLSAEVKEEIKTKLAKINGVTADKISFDGDNAVIHFDGVDEKDAPKIALRDLVLKKFTEDQIKVPAESTATVIYNPLAYSDAEIKSIKQSILDANKDNKELGLTSVDQITLSYLTGNLTASGTGNQGISNGRQENKITVKIKTDKAVAEFTSDVTKSKLTKLVNIREDYDVSWKNNKIDGRDSDEGLSWSEDHKTIIYRYDPTKAVAFKSSDITKLLTATPKAGKAGLRVLKGDEHIDHEGETGKEKKSHVYYVIDSNGEPTGALTLGIMNSGYWTGDPQITGTEKNMGDVLAKTGTYKWDDEAKPVELASKDGKIYRARLFVAPYGMESYQYVYTHPDGKNPNNTTKAINVIFVPQTNHKTSDLKKSVDEHKTVAVEGKDVSTQPAYYNASDKVKSEYDDALKVAKALYEQVKDKKESELTEKQKADIDNATIKLDKAREALDGDATNKDKLSASIEADGKAAEGANPASGTQATDRYKNVTEPDFKTPDGKADEARNNAAKEAKKAYDKALEDAKTLKEDKNATQKAVDDAKAKLDAAREKLNEFSTNKDKLNAAIAEHGHVNTGDAKLTDPDKKLASADPTYQNSTKEERKAYDDAVKKAGEVVADPNASQKEVNEAIKKLKDAKAALDKNATDKAPLDAAVQKSLDNLDPKDPNKHNSVFYTNAAAKKDTDAAAKKAVEDYDKALAEAKRVLDDKNVQRPM